MSDTQSKKRDLSVYFATAKKGDVIKVTAKNNFNLAVGNQYVIIENSGYTLSSGSLELGLLNSDGIWVQGDHKELVTNGAFKTPTPVFLEHSTDEQGTPQFLRFGFR